MGLIDNPLCRCGAEEETSARDLCEFTPWLHSDTPFWVPFSWSQMMLEV